MSEMPAALYKYLNPDRYRSLLTANLPHYTSRRLAAATPPESNTGIHDTFA
jgi:hypothetical protein